MTSPDMETKSDDRSREVLSRLIAGAVLNAVLLLMVPPLGVWSSVEREFRLAVIAASVGVVALVCLVPVLWRGKTWQPVVAIVFMVCPVLSLWFPVDFFLQYR